jgi:hypothetical protein
MLCQDFQRGEKEREMHTISMFSQGLTMVCSGRFFSDLPEHNQNENIFFVGETTTIPFFPLKRRKFTKNKNRKEE